MEEEYEAETFKTETINAIFKATWKDSSTKANKEALILACEFLRLFTIEAVHRAAEQINGDQEEDRIHVEHLERIVHQLLLDF